MVYNLKDPMDVERFNKYVERLLKGGEVVDLKKKEVGRTLKQNSYVHLIIGYFASQYGCGFDEAKIDFYKRAANRDLFERKEVNAKGVEVTYLRSSADLTEEEMSLSIDRFRYWSASVASIYLPTKEDSEMQDYAMREIDNVKEFI